MRYLYGLGMRRAVAERRQESCAPDGRLGIPGGGPGEIFVAVAIVLRLRLSVRCLIERIHTEKLTALSQSLPALAIGRESSHNSPHRGYRRNHLNRQTHRE
jgi:hypothetical protein